MWFCCFVKLFVNILGNFHSPFCFIKISFVIPHEVRLCASCASLFYLAGILGSPPLEVVGYIFDEVFVNRNTVAVGLSWAFLPVFRIGTPKSGLGGVDDVV